jgi:hypothetical protein
MNHVGWSLCTGSQWYHVITIGYTLIWCFTIYIQSVLLIINIIHVK